jgi:hypothetical protein
MFRNKKFWLDTLDGVIVASLVVALDGAEQLIGAGSWAQFIVAATALGRAILIAVVIQLRSKVKLQQSAQP